MSTEVGRFTPNVGDTYHFRVGGPGLTKNGKSSRAEVFISFCFLPVDVMRFLSQCQRRKKREIFTVSFSGFLGVLERKGSAERGDSFLGREEGGNGAKAVRRGRRGKQMRSSRSECWVLISSLQSCMGQRQDWAILGIPAVSPHRWHCSLATLSLFYSV